jgi:hypothetical protein
MNAASHGQMSGRSKKLRRTGQNDLCAGNSKRAFSLTCGGGVAGDEGRPDRIGRQCLVLGLKPET